MKKYMQILSLALALSLALSTTCFAAEDVSVNVAVDGVVLEDKGIAIEGRTLVPVRGICEALGADVFWNGEEQSVTVAKMIYTISSSGEYDVEYRDIKMVIGQTEVRVNGLIYTPLDVGPQIIDGKTMVPARAVSEWLGATVNWNGETGTVEIERALNGSFAEARIYRAEVELAERNAIDAALGNSTIVAVPSTWISEDQLNSKANLGLIDYIASRPKGFYETGMFTGTEVLYEVSDFPEGFRNGDGEGVFSNIRMKLEEGTLYFSQDDLIVAGLLSEPLEFTYVLVER